MAVLTSTRLESTGPAFKAIGPIVALAALVLAVPLSACSLVPGQGTSGASVASLARVGGGGAYSCGAAGNQSAGSLAPVRTRLPLAIDSGGMAVDGNGAVWFADSGHSQIDCYVRGHEITQFQLDPGSKPDLVKSAPDGAVWFDERGSEKLGRIGRDGSLKETGVDAGFDRNSPSLAIGPDGSVWFGNGSLNANSLSRVRPNGQLSVYAPGYVFAITVDSKGTAWLEASGVMAEVTDAGVTLQLNNPNSLSGLAQATDGNVWFLKGCGLGELDAFGKATYFDAPVQSNLTEPNSIVRAPDGAVWVGTYDGRLIRIASTTDITVYGVPWPDVDVGPFVVLRGNRVVMRSATELFDFSATNGTPVSSFASIPNPVHQGTTPDETAAYDAVRATNPLGAIALDHSVVGNHASLFVYHLSCLDHYSQNASWYAYVFEDSTGWHSYQTIQPNSETPAPGARITLTFRSSCLAVHQAPSRKSSVVLCLKSRSGVAIDGVPAYADGYVWWHLKGMGWAVQPFLMCGDFSNTLPQC